jgi:GAF domain-containing protein
VTRKDLLLQTLLELADTLVADHDISDFLHLLCERAVTLVDADEAGVLLMDRRGRLDAVAATSAEMQHLEALEASLQQGPCVEAHRIAADLDCGDLESAVQRWPDFVPEALKSGLHAVHAAPLRLRDESVGALNVFRVTPGRFDVEDVTALDALAQMSCIGILHRRAVMESREQIAQLQRALDGRRTIDQAAAVLGERVGLDSVEAFEQLRVYARRRNRRLQDIAQRYLNGDIPTEQVIPPAAG